MPAMEITGARELRQQLLYLHLFDFLQQWSNYCLPRNLRVRAVRD